jgi:hypothetical protein
VFWLSIEADEELGLKKNTHRLVVICALANLFMVRRHLFLHSPVEAAILSAAASI